MSRWRAGVVLMLAGCGLPACETGHGSVRPAPGVEMVEGVPADAVGVLSGEPERAYTVVGRVRATADARFEGRIDEARRAAERALHRQGASVGADAVLIDEAFVMDLDGGGIEPPLGGLEDDRNRQRPGGAAYATRPVHRVVLVGRAVKWAAGPGAEP
ncbi:MAG: hypothetical protein LAT64_11075 [Phycisphaerales bacterium]|nr:hypothetical protein [Planctomycetota bacterium]MCH8509293.1 hypothetical protein [Phycisphaerales bacterium]